MTARQANFTGFVVCAVLLGYAYFAQFYQHLEPCPLCIFQRIGVFCLGIAFLLAALHDPKRKGRYVYAALTGLAALLTAGVAMRHLYIQHLPEGSVPACGASLDFMLKILSVGEVLMKVLSGSGECAKITWRFLGLSMPGWVLIAALGLGAFAMWANLSPRSPQLRT